ncbi:unnamed protein product [Hapterophycus canaliculatus]
MTPSLPTQEEQELRTTARIVCLVVVGWWQAKGTAHQKSTQPSCDPSTKPSRSAWCRGENTRSCARASLSLVDHSSCGRGTKSCLHPGNVAKMFGRRRRSPTSCQIGGQAFLVLHQ